MNLPESTPKAPFCHECGRDEELEMGFVFLWDQMENHNQWWHAGCTPASLRAFLESRGWVWPEGPLPPRTKS